LKGEDLLLAMGGIDDALIAGAYARRPRRSPRPGTVRRVLTAACLCLTAVLVLAVCQLFPSFAMTAYAAGGEQGAAACTLLTAGNRVPVSLFQTKSGDSVFVFSFPADDPEAQAWTGVVYDRPDFSGCLESVAGISEEKGRCYLYYVPDLNREPPYRFTFYPPQESVGSVAAVSVTITEAAGAYAAELTSVSRRIPIRKGLSLQLPIDAPGSP